MSTPSSILRAARPAFRTQARTTQQSAMKSRYGARRFQSTAAPTAEVQAGWLKRMWDSPIGFKTVHFWAPVMKWSIVLAGIADFARPAEKLSLTQNLALTATGAIWTRWCLIIKPRNVLLATVNFFLGVVGVIQVGRILSYNYKTKNEGAAAQLEEAKEGVKEDIKGVVDSVEGAVKS